MESTSGKRKAEEQSAPHAKKNQATPERLCASCKQAKRLDEFSKGQRKKGVLARCKPCVVGDQGVVDAKQKGQQQQIDGKPKKILCCFVCKVSKSIDSFYKKERRQGCAEPKCNECSDSAARQRQEVERERQEAERQKREAERQKREAVREEKEAKKYAERLECEKANGPQIEMPTFGAPGFGPTPAMVFHQSPTTLESLLVGSLLHTRW
jgi:hypothetical protein